MYGKIERIRIVRDKKGKSKSYAFIVFERERDMKCMWKRGERMAVAKTATQPHTRTQKEFRYITRRFWLTWSEAEQ